jgi:hypothetical protein
MRFSMVTAAILVALGTVVQRFILNQIDAYTKSWFVGGATNNSTSSPVPDAAPEPTPVGSCPNDPVGEGGVRVTTAAGFYYFAGMSIAIMLVWVGLWSNRKSTLKHERYIAWQLEKRGIRDASTLYSDPRDNARSPACTRSLPVAPAPKSDKLQYLYEESTCADQCTSFVAKALGGWPGFLLFASLAATSFLYADTFRTYEQVVVQRGGMIDAIKSYLYSMPQKAAEVEGWKWATSLAFSFVSGVVRDWWYDVVKGAAIPVAGYTANVVRKTLVERKVAKTAKQLNVPAEVMDEKHAALRRQVSSSAAAAARFRRSRDPQTAQPVTGMRGLKQLVLARVRSCEYSAKGRATTLVPTTADTRQHDADGYAHFRASVAPVLLRPMSAGTRLAARFEKEGVAPGPAPSAPTLEQA